MRRRDYLLSGLITAIMLFCVSGYVFAGPAWSIEGEYFEGCTCNPGCPCLFGSEPTHNKTCKIAGVFRIQKGNYGQYSLDSQTVIGITDLTATPDKNWIVFILMIKSLCRSEKRIAGYFQNHVFGFAKSPARQKNCAILAY